MCWYIDCEEEIAFVIRSYSNDQVQHDSCVSHLAEGVRDLATYKKREQAVIVNVYHNPLKARMRA